MSLDNSNVKAPVIDSSVAERLVADAPDDLDLGLEETAARKAAKPEPVEWEDDDEDEAEEKPAKKAAKPAAKAKPADDDEDTDEDEPKPRTAAVAKDDAEDGEEEPARAALPKDRGTKEKPWTVKDLPEDGFVQVKVDGKAQTVSLKEAVSGYIRTETFQSALSRANNANEEATQIAHDALQEREAIREYFQEVFKTPKKLFDRLMQDPDEMLELGQMIAAQYQRWSKGEESIQDHKIALRERKLAAREQRIQQEREQHEQQQRMTAQQREAVERWRPVHQEALKEAGFPKLTPQFQRKFAALFRAEFEDTGGKVTPEAYKALFKEALMLAKPESTVAERKPDPRADPPRTRSEAPRNGKSKDWSSMPLNQRLRDRDYLLR